MVVFRAVIGMAWVWPRGARLPGLVLPKRQVLALMSWNELLVTPVTAEASASLNGLWSGLTVDRSRIPFPDGVPREIPARTDSEPEELEGLETGYESEVDVALFG